LAGDSYYAVVARSSSASAQGIFSYFRIVAILATLWLIAETAEALLSRAGFRSVAIDALLTLPMLDFWFLWFIFVDSLTCLLSPT
jgi:hypothetical protein